ncbi:transporter substrate-binding domain-containing protein [Devosia sp. XJ19-1]|uniref:Transporter substrate-binding domain-containing protein n=1 Tax=Devosia ureilytica TaxID=2952754 RepID=A0A9Q4AMP7_9HYPH|nr:transporter substrate-binding domain-containing protein [Devosia ureilytica]MCP8883206.1 transporter substrate-binding domain-containing protein [Devosia ureilytica]MCP8886426.1 transporter substrate-binding domain-containing protein [Devosia ureilytica]
MRVLTTILAAACVAMGMAAAPAVAQQSTIDQIKERGVLRVPAILNEDPYFNKDPRTGEWRGFVIDMAGDIAATLGVELEVVESTWANSILDVQSGKADIALALTALPTRALAISFSAPTYYNSFVIVSPKPELASATWASLNDPAITVAVDLGSSQDLITQQYLPKANVLRFKTRDEAILAVASGKADAIVNTVLNSLVMVKRNAALGQVYVPEPVLSSPSVIGINYNADEQFKSFISAWADYNRRVGNNQTWIVNGLAPFEITLDDLPDNFDLGG